MALKVGLVSLGCDKNLVDSEFMLGILKDNGFEITNQGHEANIIIINTCGFIQDAKQESIDTILDMAKFKENGKCKFLIATGCLAQRYKEELLVEMPELDAVIGTGDFYQIAEVINMLYKNKINLTQNKIYLDYDIDKRVMTYPYIAFVKIAEGCNNNCSYCAIPKIKGRYRSRSITNIKEEVEMLVNQGVKEINLIAQDTTNYGVDIYNKPSLSELLEKLVEIPGDYILRILYAYPTNIDESLLDIIKSSPKIAKYLDIPLQHINDRILRLMKRPMNSESIKDTVDMIKNKLPEITLRTTFIVGFPTETEKEFEELLNFIKKYKFDRVGAFKYSREEGTYASTLEPQITSKVKMNRYDKLMTLQRSISKRKNSNLVGNVFKVLAERYDPDRRLFIGRSEREAPFVDGNIGFTGDCVLGEVYPVKIIKGLNYDLLGEVMTNS